MDKSTEDLLTEAKAAQHQLLLGTSAVELTDSDGSKIRYTPANASKLAVYIADLEAKISAASGGASRAVGRVVL